MVNDYRRIAEIYIGVFLTVRLTRGMVLRELCIFVGIHTMVGTPDNVFASPNSQPPSADISASAWLVQKSEMGKLIAAYPWTETPFNRLESWPSHLRMVVNLMLEAGAPMAVVWGKDYRFLYNDRYRKIIQDKHPAALGAPGEKIFPEIWPEVLPLVEQAYRGEPVVVEDVAHSLNRGGETTEAFFSGSYNPIRNESGVVDGFLAVVTETTVHVARERQRAQIFDTTLSTIVDFAYSFDLDGRFLYVNKPLLDLWGRKLEDVVGKNFFDLKYPDELAGRLQRQIQEVFERKQALRDETPYVSPTSVTGYYEYIFSPVL